METGKYLQQPRQVACKLFKCVLRKLGVIIKQDAKLSPEERTYQEVWQAHQEWVNAINILDYVNEPDLVDYSIYNIETKQKKYIYLLKKAREQNITVLPLKNIDETL